MTSGAGVAATKASASSTGALSGGGAAHLGRGHAGLLERAPQRGAIARALLLRGFLGVAAVGARARLADPVAPRDVAAAPPAGDGRQIVRGGGADRVAVPRRAAA